MAGHGRRLAALEHYLSFDVPAAEEMLDQAAIHFLHINNKAMASACRLLQCLWAIKPAAATPDLEDARNNLTLIGKASPGMMVYEISLSILGAIARESGDFHLAEGCLLTSIKSAQARKSYQVLCGACFHIARLYYAQGDAEQGYRYLQQAMDLAADHGYVMFWDVHIPTVVEISLRSIRYGYRTGYAEDLLSRFCSDKTVKYLSARIKSLDENRITAFCSGFVFRYPGQASEELYFVKASLFGKTEISVNGVPIPDSEWKTKKVKGLLEYLLLSSGTAVSKEMLAEIFWPDSDSKSALASQRTALYHLRKTLTKYNADVAGNNAFIYETPEGLQIRNNETLELDIHEFLRLYQAASGLNSSASQAEQNQADLLEKMMGVYKGDLLAGIDYGDLLVQERERFKSIFLEACQKLSSIYLERSDLSLAEGILKRALATDPYHESLCLQLLNLYVSQGRRSKAVKLYYSFKKRLEQDLDIKVDKRLTEAIRQV